MADSVAGLSLVNVGISIGKKVREPLVDVWKNSSILGIMYKHKDKIADVAKKAYDNAGAYIVNNNVFLRMKAFDESYGTAYVNRWKSLLGSDSVPKVPYEPLFK